MITWTMTLCLKLVALGMAQGCVPSTTGAELANFSVASEGDSAIIQCQGAPCLSWIKNDTTHRVIALPRRNAFLLLPLEIPEQAAGEITIAAERLSR